MALVRGVILRFGVGRIDVECRRIDVDEYRPGAQSPHGPRGGKERIARQQHLVRSADAGGHQCQQQGIASRGTGHGEAGLAILRQPLFQLFAVGPEDEPARVADLGQGGVELGPQQGVLTLDVQERHAGRLGCMVGDRVAVRWCGGLHRAKSSKPKLCGRLTASAQLPERGGTVGEKGDQRQGRLAVGGAPFCPLGIWYNWALLGNAAGPEAPIQIGAIGPCWQSLRGSP